MGVLPMSMGNKFAGGRNGELKPGVGNLFSSVVVNVWHDPIKFQVLDLGCGVSKAHSSFEWHGQADTECDSYLHSRKKEKADAG